MKPPSLKLHRAMVEYGAIKVKLQHRYAVIHGLQGVSNKARKRSIVELPLLDEHQSGKRHLDPH